jgi:outer membrane protein TolC
MRVLFLITIAAVLAGAAPQDESLSVQQAIANALTNHPSLKGSREATLAAAARTSGMRGAFLPRVNYSEGWQRSDNPVFVFGSLLNQRQFTAANFDLGLLNNPPFLNNFQSQIGVEQTVFNGGHTQAQLKSARLGHAVAEEETRRTEMQVIGAVLRTYYSALLSQENARVAAEAVRSAEADLKRAETRLAAGATTESDMLSLRVHLAAMREQQIRRDAGVKIGFAELNEAMGLSLDSSFHLTTVLRPAETQAIDGKQVEADALANRPEPRQARLATEIGGEQEKVVRAAMMPEITVRAGFEVDRQTFATRGGVNWVAGAGLRWNLFNGFSDRARADGARHETERSRATELQVAAATRLGARRVWLELQAAAQRIEVARATVAMAAESLRIVRNRYEAGLAEVTELLRAETAMLEAQARDLEAVRDQRLAAVTLEEVRGTLSTDSEVVKK